MSDVLKAPFPYFGGKSAVAAEVWSRLGNPANFIEPFLGSAAVLLARPAPINGTETVNDADANVSNFWRAMATEAGAIAAAEAADWPVLENCLHARHAWLVSTGPERKARLEGDPLWFDPQAAGWWAWVMSCWIGSGCCSGQGPWHVADGRLVKTEPDGAGTNRQLPNLGDAGAGVNRKLPHLGDAGQGECQARREYLVEYFKRLSDRLRNVRVCCGDWSRICGPSPTTKQGLTGVFLDPPYSAEAGRDMNIYAVDCGQVAHDVRAWCEEHGDDPLFRIVLCGYTGEGHDGLVDRGWTAWAWKANGGYAGQGRGEKNTNNTRETIWFSPHCLRPQGGLF